MRGGSIYIYIYIYVCVYTYIYIDIYIHIYVYIVDNRDISIYLSFTYVQAKVTTYYMQVGIILT